MRSRYLLPVAAGAWLALILPVHADTYRWVDESGRVHYSDRPPPGNVKQQKEIKTRSRAAVPASSAEAAESPKSYVEQDAEFRRRQAERAEKEAAEQRARQEAQERRRNCDQARARLAALQAGARVTRYNDKGEQEYLDDRQIAEEIRQTQKSVADWCG
ncbi:MAG TPA: DUF4124 domain-containing protein [Burkholderiales bacterium]|jgi:hypothetical protein|nr:DUF4124 domain-containing protein [Burkholderiales bacterium]